MPTTAALRYPSGPSMGDLIACPFCRELFELGEAKRCPECGLGLTALRNLPPSYDATHDDLTDLDPPHMHPLPWSFMGRGRGLMLAIAAIGMVMFFAPWVYETAPERREMSGFSLARHLGWLWAPAIAWFVMLPLVATRRSIYRMRGARVAVAFLAGIVLTTAGVRLAFTPISTALRPVRIEWGWGLYATFALGLVAAIASYWFGGRLDDIPSAERRRGDETLH